MLIVNIKKEKTKKELLEKIKGSQLACVLRELDGNALASLRENAAGRILIIDRENFDSLPDFFKDKTSPNYVILASSGDIRSEEHLKFVELGADDIIEISMEKEVLIAKISAYVRRLKMEEKASSLKSATGFFELDLGNSVLMAGGEKKICDFTSTELRIFKTLLARSLKIVERELILESVYENKKENMNFETVDRHIQNIRKKMGRHGNRLKSVYGIGYILNA